MVAESVVSDPEITGSVLPEPWFQAFDALASFTFATGQRANRPDRSQSTGRGVVTRVDVGAASEAAHTRARTTWLPWTGRTQPVDTRPQVVAGGIADALREIERLTGLPRVRIAEDLLGVTRQAFYDWLGGVRPTTVNERRIRGIVDVLGRATQRLGGPDAVRNWLLTPAGSRAVAPIDLMRESRLDEARLHAVSHLPVRSAPLPDWLLNAPVDEWSAREQRRRDHVVRERDESTFPPDSEQG